ncbi:hypothetical protein TcasGA2_TC000646 [Tribolium castaneum]|uniref:Uncharacterized protein n=1 Tax=Tribolium castaneum TaxID=7070 RepID=D6W937_TRICA|nr:hypothetical protein TcasGA2_TC000646 [Tribolium castaneum]
MLNRSPLTPSFPAHWWMLRDPRSRNAVSSPWSSNLEGPWRTRRFPFSSRQLKFYMLKAIFARGEKYKQLRFMRNFQSVRWREPSIEFARVEENRTEIFDKASQGTFARFIDALKRGLCGEVAAQTNRKSTLNCDLKKIIKQFCLG